MDPLSITGTVIAVAGLAAAVGNGFKELRSLCKTLPGRLHALSNEVTDIEMVLFQVASKIENRGKQDLGSDSFDSISQLVERAKGQLHELDFLVKKLKYACCKTKLPILQLHVWRKDQQKLKDLQERINSIKCSLNMILGASNSQDMLRIQMELDAVAIDIANSLDDQTEMHQEIQTSLSRNHSDLASSLGSICQHVDHRIDTIEELLRDQTRQFESNQARQIGDLCRLPPLTRYQRTSHSAGRRQQHPYAAEAQGVSIRAKTKISCNNGCTCSCHSHTRASTPGIFDRILGQMFVGYVGLPLLGSRCNSRACEKRQAAQISVEYWFPIGYFWSSIFRIQMSYQPNLGPQFELQSLRRVSDSAQCVNLALDGDIEGLKNLFKRGLASPRDVSSTRGYSLLRWAMYGKNFQACRFLLHAGADPDYRPIALTDNSPRHKAHQFLLMGGLADEDVEALRSITQDSDFLEEQNYSILHKIVLGLSMLDLEEQIRFNPELLNAVDAMDRTPLAWAACRTDERAIVILLKYGAEVNTVDVQHSGVVGHAADRNSSTCVRLLLEAGADPNIASAHGFQVADPLNVAARNADDPLVLKTLLDFGADVETCGVDGMTPLIHASWRDKASFALLLLEYSANINAVSASGHTPLTIAIIHNSHNVLKLLLDRWFEYTACPRLRGSHLLDLMVVYADIETMRLMAESDHVAVNYDKQYGAGDFVERLKTRADNNSKLMDAFNELLDAINRESVPNIGKEGMLELGLSGLNMDSDSDADDEFKDATEFISKTLEEAKMQRARTW